MQNSINNTILENKHYYMQILQNAEVLVKKFNVLVIQDESKNAQLQDINCIRNIAFAGLLREALSYEVVINKDVPAKSFVRLIIDNVNYDCTLPILKDILKDDYDLLVRCENQSNATQEQQTNNKTTDNSLSNKTDYMYMAYHDPLTSLKNRAALLDDLKNIHRKGTCIISFDADNLKETNDMYGHSYGDQLLCKIASTLTQIFHDNIYRVGGDEFVVVVSNVGKKIVEQKLTQVVQQLTDLSKKDKDGIMYDTSFGYAIGDGILTLQELIEEADGRMYQQKRKKKAQATVKNDNTRTLAAVPKIQQNNDKKIDTNSNNNKTLTAPNLVNDVDSTHKAEDKTQKTHQNIEKNEKNKQEDIANIIEKPKNPGAESKASQNIDVKEKAFEKMFTTAAEKPKLKQPEVLSSKQPVIPPTTIASNHKIFESHKSLDTMLYDICDFSVFPSGAASGRNFHMIIIPLYPMHDGFCDIAVAATCNGHIAYGTSSVQKSSVQMTLCDTELLIRGDFSQGEFNSHVLLSGSTLKMGYEINQNTITIRPKNPMNYGHVLFEYDNMRIHAFPLDSKNAASGIVQALICIENTNVEAGKEKIIDSFVTSENSINLITINNVSHKIITYWQQTMFSCDIL